MVRAEQAAALAQLWTSLAAFLDRTVACLAASCQEAALQRDAASLVSHSPFSRHLSLLICTTSAAGAGLLGLFVTSIAFLYLQ